MRHALILGAIGVLFSTLGAIAQAQMQLGPAWYAWALVILALPCAWLGGRQAESRFATPLKA
jgi:lysozyme family protein